MSHIRWQRYSMRPLIVERCKRSHRWGSCYSRLKRCLPGYTCSPSHLLDRLSAVVVLMRGSHQGH